MSSTSEPYSIVIGGGIVGLYVSYYLTKKYPRRRVLLVEKGGSCGGLLRTRINGQGYTFDYGVHTFYETKIGPLDEFLMEICAPSAGWNYLKDYDRDLGGTIINNKLFSDSMYLNLDVLPLRVRGRCRKEIKQILLKGEPRQPKRTCIAASDVLTHKYGITFATEFAQQLFYPKFGKSLSETHALAISMRGLDRVVDLSLSQILSYSGPADIRSRLAFPNQKSYPEQFLSDKVAYYPKKGGCEEVIKKAIDVLSSNNVQIVTDASVSHIAVRGGNVAKATIQTPCKLIQVNVHDIHITVPLSNIRSLTKELSENISTPVLDDLPFTYIVNLVVSDKPKSDGIYYAYCHDETVIHRVSFPDNYSSSGSCWRIGVECITPNLSDPESVKNLVVDYLLKSKIIGDLNSVVWMEAVSLGRGGYPPISKSAIEAKSQEAAILRDIGYTNLHHHGVLSEPNLFFQFDVLRRSHERLESIT